MCVCVCVYLFCVCELRAATDSASPTCRLPCGRAPVRGVDGQDGAGRPATGFAEHTSEEGTYRGEWQDGQPHGTGTFFYSTGVRYSGSWRNGRPFGQGSWTREKPRVAPPKRARAAQCKCKVPAQLVERRLIEPISYTVFLKHEWPRGARSRVPAPCICACARPAGCSRRP